MLSNSLKFSYEAVDRNDLINGFATALSTWLPLAGSGKKGIGKFNFGNVLKLGASEYCRTIPQFERLDKCTDPEFYDPEVNRSSVTWDQFGAGELWCDVLKELKSVKRDTKTFGSNITPSQKVAQLFKYTGARDFKCQPPMYKGCDVIKCPSQLTSPAATLILNSFVYLATVSAISKRCGIIKQ
jgi:hypothetical protein